MMSAAFKALYDATEPTQELINNMGGITVNGQKYKIKILVEDDQSSPQGAVAAVDKLIQDGVQFLIPPMFPACNMAIAPITKDAKILRIKSFGNGRQEVNEDTPYSFYSNSSVVNIPYVYDYLEKKYPAVQNIAIITPDDPGMGTAREIVERTIKERGKKIVFNEAYKIGTQDFYPILTKALEAKPDAIEMIVAIPPWAIGIINQSRELGFTGPIYSTCIFGDVNLVNGNITREYAYDIINGGPDVLSPKMLPFVQDLRKIMEKKGIGPFIMDSTIVLDALWPLLQGIEKAQSFDTEKVANALVNMKKIDTLFGPGTMKGKEIFGINHVIFRPIAISTIMDGKVDSEFIELK